MSHCTAPCFALAALAAAYTVGTNARPSQDPAGFDPQTAAMLEQMKTAHENPTAPGAFHEKLNHFIGEWDVTISMWMMGPGTPTVTSEGEASVEWMLDKRFTMETMTFELNMGGASIPMESVQITGYDNYRNVYVGNMYSSMSTEIIPIQGGVSPDGNAFNFYGTMHEPMLNIAGRMVRFVTRIVDEDHHVVEVYDLHAGPDHKVLEFAYARR